MSNTLYLRFSSGLQPSKTVQECSIYAVVHCWTCWFHIIGCNMVCWDFKCQGGRGRAFQCQLWQLQVLIFSCYMYHWQAAVRVIPGQPILTLLTWEPALKAAFFANMFSQTAAGTSQICEQGLLKYLQGNLGNSEHQVFPSISMYCICTSTCIMFLCGLSKTKKL